MTDNPTFKVEIVALAALKPHPRNYHGHPQDQVDHLKQSITEHGQYKNVVIAQDNTILAGEGLVKAATQLGRQTIAAYRVDIPPDSPQALKILTGDNEISRLAEINDRLLTELLKEVRELDTTGLLGTGFDEQMLTNLVFVSRPASEIQDFNEAAHWVGLPEYEDNSASIKLIVSFRTEADRQALLDLLGVTHLHGKLGQTWSIWWPEKEREDAAALRFES